jgi:hypothetical protein
MLGELEKMEGEVLNAKTSFSLTFIVILNVVIVFEMLLAHNNIIIWRYCSKLLSTFLDGER